MHAALLRMKAPDQKGLLYPLLVIAAIAVIIFSALGAAAIVGWLPRAESTGGKMPPPQQDAVAPPQRQGAVVAPYRERVAANRDAAACPDCGVIASIAPVEVKGRTNGLGMIAGGVTGALLGNQIGRGNGNAVATIGGAAGGAFAGNEIEQQMKKSVQYEVRVRMRDGTFRTTHQSSAPPFAVGDKVRFSNGRVVKAG